VVNNKNKFQMNSEIHNINAKNNSAFYQPLSHMNIYQKDPFYTGIKIDKSLPPEVKDFSYNIKKFKSPLRGLIHQQSFYTLEEWKGVILFRTYIFKKCTLCHITYLICFEVRTQIN
jgi:hypothetical protein